MSKNKIEVYVVEFDLFTETWLVSKLKVSKDYYQKAKSLSGIYIYRNKSKANRIAKRLNRKQ